MDNKGQADKMRERDSQVKQMGNEVIPCLSFRVECRCGAEASVPARSAHGAGFLLVVDHGWRMIDGLPVCPDCVNKGRSKRKMTTELPKFVEVTNEYEKQEGGERHVMMFSDKFWVSVFHRRTGFGYMEWETAFVRVRGDDEPLKCKLGKWDTKEVNIVIGDRREALKDMNQEQVMAWYETVKKEKNSMESILDALT